MKIKTYKQLTDIKTYIENKQFSLKDYSETLKKYQDYKKEKVTAFFKENDEDIKHFIENSLVYQIEDALNNNHYLQTDLTKSSISNLKTIINAYTKNNLIPNYIKTIEDFNPNELRSFGILFYLKYYESINEIMKEGLTEYLQNRHGDVLEIESEHELKKFLICKELSEQ